MSSFKLTQSAKADFKSIARYSEKRWGRNQRNLYVNQFDTTFSMLGDTPSAGTACDFIRKGYRMFPQGSHIIFYREISKNEIQIVRILHKRMDVVSKFCGS